MRRLQRPDTINRMYYLWWMIETWRRTRRWHKALKASNPPCSFCGRTYRDMDGLMVEAKEGILICELCLDYCRKIIDDEKRRREDRRNDGEEAAQ
ncbi:MAG: hypothetical protein HY290_01095 [Planctomycetia bacterium]|nr:hypothetical protein [Planctomycetia bacterium]